MSTPVPQVEIARKGTETASKAMNSLLGDIYVREWETTKIVGKGKKKRTVTTKHSLHANPVTLAIGAAVTAATVGGALWIAQLKAQPTFIDDWAIVKHTQVYKAAWDETVTGGWVTPIGGRRYRETVTTVHHEAIPDVWTCVRLGVKYKGSTAVEAFKKAYPKVSTATIEKRIEGDTVYYLLGKKKKLAIAQRQGFNLFAQPYEPTADQKEADAELVAAKTNAQKQLGTLFGLLGK